MKRLLLSLLIVLLSFFAFSQEWELLPGSFQDFDEIGTLASIPNISEFKFSLKKFGATGLVSDICARSKNTSNSYIAFYFLSLDASYEYRIVVNAKTTTIGNAIRFLYSTSVDNINNANPISSTGIYIIPNDNPGQDYYSEAFSIPANGGYFLIIRPSGTPGRVRIDDFRVERRLNLGSFVSFTNPSITITEGGETQLCLQINNPDANLESTVILNFLDNGLPHFANLSVPLEVTFPAGSDQNQCITLSPEILNVSKSYRCSIQTRENETHVNISEPYMANVYVNPEDISCSCSGENFYICQGDVITLSCDLSEDCSSYCTKWSPDLYLNDASSVDETSITVAPEETTTYTFSVTGDDGEILNQTIFTVFVGDPFQASIVASSAINCADQPIQITAYPEGSQYSYDWADIEGLEEEPNVRTITELGEYTVTITHTENNCSSVASYTLRDQDDVDVDLGILEFFRSRDFMEFDIEILGPIEGGRSPQNTEFVRDEVGLLIHFDGNDNLEFNLQSHLQALLENEDITIAERKAFISGNNDFCHPNAAGVVENIIAEIEMEFGQQQYGYWIHLWENPDENQTDKFFIRARTPTHDGSFTPDSELMSGFIHELVVEVATETELYGYAGKSEQEFDIILDQLADFYDTSLEERINGEGEESGGEEPTTFYGCDGLEISEQSSYYLNVAGKTITLPIGSIAHYLPGRSINYDHDLRALTSFLTPEGKQWLSIGYPNGGHEGFIFQKSPKKEDTYTFPAISNLGCESYYLGMARIDGSCFTYNVGEYKYEPNETSFPSGERKGPPVPDFDNNDIITFCGDLDFEGNPHPEGNVVSTSCIPLLTASNFNTAEEDGRFNPFGEKGIIFEMDVTMPGESVPSTQIIYGRFEGIDPEAGLQYYIWDCVRYGGWHAIETPMPEIPPHFDFFKALYSMIFVDDSGFLGHLTLDVLSVVPIIGIPSDLAQAEWYLSEGDFVNTGFALIGTIPFFGDAIQFIRQGVKLVFEVGGKVYRTRSLYKLSCVPGFTGGTEDTGGSRFSIGVLSSSFNPPPCNKIFQLIFEQLTLKGGDILPSPGSADEALRFFQIKEYVRFVKNVPRVTGTALSKMFDKNIDLLRAWFSTFDDGFTAGKRLGFFEWLRSTIRPADNVAQFSSQITRIANNPAIVKGWRLLDKAYGNTNNLRKNDIDLMEKVAELLNNSTFMQRITGGSTNFAEQRTVLLNIIKKNKRAPCSTCGPPSVSHLDEMADYLETVSRFTNTFHDIEGFEQVITALQRNLWTVEGTIYQMRFLLDNALASTIIRFEPPLGNLIPASTFDNIVDGSEEIAADVYNSASRGDFESLIDGVRSLNELKSYKKSTFSYMQDSRYNTQFVNQLKGYLGNMGIVNNIENVNYFFDAKKLVKTDASGAAVEGFFASADDALSFVKDKFKTIFTEQGDEIFQEIMENPMLRESLGEDFFPIDDLLEARTNFSSLASDTTSDLYRFIKVQ